MRKRLGAERRPTPVAQDVHIENRSCQLADERLGWDRGLKERMGDSTQVLGESQAHPQR